MGAGGLILLRGTLRETTMGSKGLKSYDISNVYQK